MVIQTLKVGTASVFSYVARPHLSPRSTILLVPLDFNHPALILSVDAMNRPCRLTQSE